MRHALLVVMLVLSAVVAPAQERNSEDRRYVAAPPENFLLTVAALPDNPLQFENAQLMIDTNKGAISVKAQIRNRSNKAVRRFTAVIWTSFGTGGTLGGSEWSPGKITDKLILPGEVVNHDCDGVVVQLTEELRQTLKLKGPMKAIVVLLIETVVFEDGSVYSAETASNALRQHFERLARVN